MKFYQYGLISILSFSAISSHAFDSNSKVEEKNIGSKIIEENYNKFFIGVFGGISTPPEKVKINKPDFKANAKVKGTSLYGAQIGYYYTPEMSVSFSYMVNPKYNVEIPLKDVVGPLSKDQPWKDAKVILHYKMTSPMLEFSYSPAFETKFKPYITLGIGYSCLKATKAMFVGQTDLPVEHVPEDLRSNDLLKGDQLKTITQHNVNYKFGVGATYDVTDNITLNASASVNYIRDFRIKLSTKSLGESGLEDKRAFGAVNFASGIIFKF